MAPRRSNERWVFRPSVVLITSPADRWIVPSLLTPARCAPAVLIAVLLATSIASPAVALPRKNPANRLLKVPVDKLTYEHAKRCRKTMTKGALALSRWLDRNTRGSYWGGLRCERLSKSSFSMHAEGRAVDWHLDASNPADRREARRLLKMLFSPDSDGNENALARRMGIIEAIWDCRYYGYWMTGKPSRYGACRDSRGKPRRGVDRTIAHRNHIHFSLSWSGAHMRTSYWKYAWLKRPLPKTAKPPLPEHEPQQSPGVDALPDESAGDPSADGHDSYDDPYDDQAVTYEDSLDDGDADHVSQ